MKIRSFSLFQAVIVLLLWHLCSFAQDIHFETVKPPEDVTWQLSSGISQDPNGFLWIANYSGVYKYDGQKYVHYLHDPKNPNTISDNRIECILAAKNGIVWIGTYIYGLDRLDPSTGIVTHFRHQDNVPSSLSNDTVTVLMEDKDGTLWVGTYGGLDHFNPGKGTFKHFSYKVNDSNSLSNNLVRAIYEDHEGVIWVGTGSPFNENALQGAGGLNRFDRNTGTLKRYLHDPQNPNSISDNRVRAIFEDSRGIFWIGTAGDGLQTLDRTTGKFTHYPYDPAHPEKLSRPPLENNLAYVTDNITFITEDNTGKIWIGTMEGGINVYDPSTEKITHYGTEKNSGEQLATNGFWYAYKSRDGVIWITTWGASNSIYLLYKINPYKNKLPYYPLKEAVIAVVEDTTHTLWFGTNKGLLHKDNKGDLHQFLLDKDTSSHKNVIMNLINNKNNNTIWLATRGGLYQFDPVTKSFVGFHHQNGNIHSLLSDTVISLSLDTPDRLWVGTYRGLQLLDINTGKFLKNFQNDPNNSNSITNNEIESIYPDNNHLWIGTGLGLNRLDLQTGDIKKYILNNEIFYIMKDSRGIMWTAIIQGLVKYNKEEDKFAPYSDPSGTVTASSVIFWIVEDHGHNLWLRVSSGIIKVNLENGTSVKYGEKQGVFDINISDNGIMRDNGDIVFGKRPGFYEFKPEQIIYNSPPPLVSITNFYLASKPVTPAPGGVLQRPIWHTTGIRLKYNQNTFSFDFASIDYGSQTENNHLQYMMVNYDHNWQIANENTTAYYFNMQPGNYIFKVKAVNENGLWSEKDISIIISPPWWHTWWAYSIFGILFIAIIWTFIYYRSRQLLHENRILEEKVNNRTTQLQQSLEQLKSTQNQLIQSEKMASLGELTAGIAHEIQNPLNFVNNFSEVSDELIDEMKIELENGNKQEAIVIANEVKQNLDKIIHHGKRADAIVKGMLQHSRSSTMQKELTDINALTDEYLRLSYHGLRAKDKSFNATLLTNFDESIGKINIIPQDIGRVLLNLFNNAFYAISEKKASTNSEVTLAPSTEKKYEPTVFVSTRKIDNQRIEIKVKDNGSGISQKVVDKIFQPFFTTKPTGLGTGLGLSLSYDIIKAHKGEIKMETTEGEYTEFSIHLPI